MRVVLEWHEAGDAFVVALEGVDEPFAVLNFFILDVLPDINVAHICGCQEVSVLGEHQHIPDLFF